MKRILLAAVVVTLAACGRTAKTDNTADVAGALPEVSDKIAYVNLDSLRSGYDMYVELSAAYATKVKAAETDVASRGRALERKMADAQNKVEKGLVTRAEAAQLQETLAREQQNFLQFQSRKEEELAEEEMVMMNKIMYSIHEFVAEYNSDYRYGMILTTSGGAPVLHADPSMDITVEVLRGLNERYKNSKE